MWPRCRAMDLAGRSFGGIAKVPGMPGGLHRDGNRNRNFSFHRDVLANGVNRFVRGVARVSDGQIRAPEQAACLPYKNYRSSAIFEGMGA